MKVVISSVILAGLLGLVNAKVHLTNSNFDGIEAGSTFEITWDDAEGPVTLTLKNGAEDDLQDVQTITTNASGDSFEWAVDSALVTGDYAIEIDDGTDVNYSVMFSVDGVAAPSSSAVSSTVSATSSTASPSSTSAESTSTESSSTESTTTSASSTSTTASSSASTTVSSSVTRTTSSTPTATTSDAAETSVPNTNDARGMAAPLGLLAIIGAALL
ncbi:Ser-Thr-rich glycosyl-phosphatidyl-inositol-anchored membrane family-domain-containing protein [Nemania sp. FL0031]|nr:Ser-Thr-rich glycosyl-phosphatidyl-inositol-anchored membrane family-domain-containing protein [Nemania sp. FL0031]